jgi:methyl-accepting chemotaxis protein
MKLRGKLLAAPLATAVVALGVAAVHAWTLHDGARHDRAALMADIAGYKALGEANVGLGVLQSGVYRTLAILNSLDEAQVKAFGDKAGQQIDAMKAALQALGAEPAADEQLREQLQTLLPLLATYQKQVAKALELSAIDANMGVAAMKAAEASFGKLGAGMADVVARTEVAARDREAASQQQAARRAALFALLALLATGAAVAASWVMQRRLAGELTRAVTLTQEVAAGQLTAAVRTDRNDEIGDLLRALGDMVGRLRDSIQTVQAATGSIGTASQGNTDLSQRTEQTASSLQQTASSMEQLTGTVRRQSRLGAQANQLATSASRGGAAAAARWCRRW